MTAFKTTPLRHARPLAALLAAALLAGCAALAPAPQTPEDSVLARANARWAAMLKRDFATAYGYLAPGVRAVIPEKTFVASVGNAVQWTNVQASKVRCDQPDQCVATVSFEAKVFNPRMKNRTVKSYYEETWVLQDGQWWLFAKF